MVEELIEKFVRAADCPPKHLLVFRHGVSESQYPVVLNWEVPAFKGAVKRLSDKHMQGNWSPSLTFCICQRRNQTRLVPANRQDADRTGNFPAGFIPAAAADSPSSHALDCLGLT
eukprot:784967-Rhodomonas_salina.10